MLKSLNGLDSGWCPSIKKQRGFIPVPHEIWVFPRFVTETHPGWKLGPGCSGWTIQLAWWSGRTGEIWAPQNANFWNWWNNWKSPQKGGPVEFKGGGKATGGAKRASRCWRCWFESQAKRGCRWFEWRSFGCHSADWFWELCPFLAQKWGPFFVKILCQGYVSQLLRIYAYSSRAYVFFDFSAYFWGMQTGSHKEVPVRNDGGASKMYLLLSNCTGGSLINYPPPLNSWQKNRFNSGPLTCARWRFNIGGCRNLAAPGKTWCVREMCGIHFLELLYDRTHNILYQYQWI